MSIAKRAQSNGVKYLLNSPVRDIKISDDGVRVEVARQGERLNLEARAVVIAAGFGLRLVERLGLGKIGDFVMGVQAEVEAVGLDEMEVYFNQEIAPGFFAWLVPTSPPKALVGLALRRSSGFYMRKLMFVMLFLLIIPIVCAEQKHMHLLAVKESNGEYIGSLADLYLEVKSGSGRVFMETFPLSKLDTQISTRFAKEIACQKSDIDCSHYDFFYTIKSDAPIIGGPSAGAAISALTYILLNNYNYDNSITVTGTINSGGLVGSVGGIIEKIEAAAKENLSLVLIPIDKSTIEKDNETTDVQQYADNISVNVAFVSDLNDMLYYFSGIEKQEIDGELIVNEQYTSIMKEISDNLCARALDLNEELSALRHKLRNVKGS